MAAKVCRLAFGLGLLASAAGFIGTHAVAAGDAVSQVMAAAGAGRQAGRLADDKGKRRNATMDSPAIDAGLQLRARVSSEGAARTRKLVKALVEHDFTIVSGLAQGVDTVAHNTAIEAGGRTIAVIGTPISEVYPRENADLQRRIASEYLLVSQVPVLRYKAQGPNGNRLFFPERNKTMSALTEATIIIEAGETSGTLIQAKAALDQGRKLFILDNCFRNPKLTWPARFQEQGAIRVTDIDDIRAALG